MTKNTNQWRRILWVRLDHIGDVVMSLPMLAALRRDLPEAEIDCLVRPAVAPLLEAAGLDIRVLTFDTPRFPEKRSRIAIGPFGRGGGVFRGVALLRRLRNRHYDAAFELRGDEVGRVIVAGSGAPVRIGPDRQFYEAVDARNGKVLLTEKVPLPPDPRHAVLNNLALLEAAGLASEDPGFRFPVSEDARRRVEAKLIALEVEEPCLLLHPCSNDAKRNWTVEKWVELIHRCRRISSAPILLTGSARDHVDVARIISLCGESGVYDAAGRFALGDLPALFERSNLLVTVDTGPMHIAAMQGLPIVALMRADLAPRHHPWGQPENVVTAEENVSEIEVVPVWEKVESFLTARLLT